MSPKKKPTFTLIAAVYNVASYLPDFMGSLERQRGGLDDTEILFVSDGSPDDSAELIEAWIARTGAPGKLLTKENGGAGSARNFGLDHASGEWVMFTDPDDAISDGYLEGFRAALAAEGSNKKLSILAAQVLQFGDDPRAALDNHILGYRYHEGRQLVSLAKRPTFFHAHVPSGFYRRTVIDKNKLRFDERLRVAFDDATFAAEYTLAVDDPHVLVVPDSQYLYRRRIDGSSLVGTMWSKPDKYTKVPRFGYLRLLSERTPAPLWLQCLVLYDLEWFFREYIRPNTPNRDIDADVAKEFLGLLDQILPLIDSGLLYGFPLNFLERDIRFALTVRKSGKLPWYEGRVTNKGEDLQLVHYSTSADPASSHYLLNGVQQEDVAVTVSPIEFYDEAFLYRHSAVVPIERAIVVEAEGNIVQWFEDRTGAHLGGAIFERDLDRLARAPKQAADRPSLPRRLARKLPDPLKRRLHALVAPVLARRGRKAAGGRDK